MSQAPDLRVKLETAIKCNQQQQALNTQRINSTNNDNKSSTTPTVQQPTIKLKTDFSNFS
jgi:hypothetical protein